MLRELVGVTVKVGVLDGVKVGATDGMVVFVALLVAVIVTVGVFEGVGVAVSVGRLVFVTEGMVTVNVGVLVETGVGEGTKH